MSVGKERVQKYRQSLLYLGPGWLLKVIMNFLCVLLWLNTKETLLSINSGKSLYW